MVFSFMGTQARILQAHFDDRGLSVYASRLYDFNTPSKATESMVLFLRYMCSVPGGRTVSHSLFDRRARWKMEHNVPRPVLHIYEQIAMKMIQKHWQKTAA
ncbi:hypothetical protein BDV12DRAFT_177159 [Aspergillus spectabilis]